MTSLASATCASEDIALRLGEQIGRLDRASTLRRLGGVRFLMLALRVDTLSARAAGVAAATGSPRAALLKARQAQFAIAQRERGLSQHSLRPRRPCLQSQSPHERG